MILVTGATGKIGRSAVEGLLESGQAVRALSRQPDNARLPAEVEVFPGAPGDVDSVRAALTGVDSAFVVLVGDVETQARGFATAAGEASGLRRLVALSSSAVVHPVPHRIGTEHRRAEDSLRGIPAECAFLRPGPFHSNALWWAASIREQNRARCLVGNRPGAPVDPADIAAVAVRLLVEPRFRPGEYELTGDEVLSSADQVAILSEILGREIAFTVADPDEAVDTFAAISGDRAGAETDVRALHSPAVPWARTAPTVRAELGRPARAFRVWARENAQSFR